MNTGILLYVDDINAFRDLISPKDFGRCVLLAADYAVRGEVSENGLPTAAKGFLRILCAKIDRDQEAYRKRAAGGSKGGRPRKNQKNLEVSKVSDGYVTDTDTDTDTDTETDTECINDNDTARAREETPFGPVEVDPLIVKVQRELLGLTDTHYALLGQYRDELGDELVSYAVDQAVGNGVRKWAYVERVLQAWSDKGIRTVGEAKAEDERRRKESATGSAPAPRKKTVTAQQFPQRDYSDSALEDQVFGNFLKYAREEAQS